MVADGCPGGSSGNEDASTTLSLCTPITLACESTTDFGSLLLPMAPKKIIRFQRDSHTQNPRTSFGAMKDLQVQATW